ncbi:MULTISPECIES: SGNH/GDSL hydrolase family protein [Pseudomonas]|uniref:SGNH/GDSL hydrolase family protein n=1 Tax=Pseudomonas TaxID=286 RepID=UPI00159F86E8|nr:MULTISPECIES: SGNH/GDSL hydrolase family protein [Pseudomonas]NVZ88168.1 SGNH/GDSL hydrolase family protein [Pseudomonas yamanorum]NWD85681.1 SGNH/GDSL hydrolase family protein [Pseudomonas sp. K5002]
MATHIYRAGTVSIAAGAVIATGAGTSWLSNAVRGDVLVVPSGQCFELVTVETDTRVTLDASPNAEITNVPYVLLRFVTNQGIRDLLEKIEEFLKDRQVNLAEFADWTAGTAAGGPNHDGKYPLTDRYGTVTLAECPAKLAAIAGQGGGGGGSGTVKQLNDVLPNPEGKLTVTAGDIGAATAEQGSKADSAVQKAQAMLYRPLLTDVLVLGDSRAFQCTKGNVGFADWAVSETGGLAAFPLTLNKGIDGNTTSQMVARLQADVIANSNAFDVMVHFGTGNDRLNGMSLEQTIRNLEYLYAALIKRGKVVIAIAETPVIGANVGLPIQQTANHFAVHNWYLNVAPSLGVIVVNPWDEMVDPASGTSYWPKEGMTGDGLHPTPMGARIIGRKVGEALKRLFTFPAILPTSSVLYDAAAVPGGSLIPNALLTGTNGTLGAGSNATGQLATSCTLQGTNLNGLAVTASKEAADIGEKQVLRITGMPSAATPTLTLEQSVDVSKVAVGQRLRAIAGWEFSSVNTSVLQVALQVVAVSASGTTIAQIGQNQELNHAMPIGNIAGTLVTQILALAQAPTSLKFRLSIIFKTGTGQDATIKLRQADLTRIFA